MGYSIWQTMEQKGYSRRDFLQFCAAAATVAGFGQTGIAQVVSAFEKKEKPTVVWMHFQKYTRCTESFIRSSHPIVADALLDVLSFNYTKTPMAASGCQAEKRLNDTIQNKKGKYIVLVEGAVPMEDEGAYCMTGGRTAASILQTVAKDAAAVVAWGSCASNGCVQAAKPNATGATPIHRLVDKPVINVPGCPPIADVLMGVVTHLLVLGQIPALDNQGRLKEFYGRRFHETTYRRPNYDAGLFIEPWNDDNAHQENYLDRMGCKGPVSYSACSAVSWNEGASYPIQPDHGGIGCSEEGFWDNDPFYQRLTSFPGIGMESTADAVSTVVGVATLGRGHGPRGGEQHLQAELRAGSDACIL